MNALQPPAARSENAAGPAHESPGSIPLVLVAVAAVGLRLAAARDDLVLDEIWSWRIASKVDSAAQIFVTYVDNNHILNTLVLYALGPRAPLWAYRLPAVVAGILALGFALGLAKRQGSRAAFNVLVLLSFSHLLILFGTEARGYGYLACCTLGAWWALESYLDRPRLRYASAFGVISSLGFLSHATFLFAWLAFGIYSALKLTLRRGRWQRLVVLNALPVLTCVGLLFAYFEGMSIGGGNPIPTFDTLLATLS
ncbi:MAG TPA: glycosyltransferase family 39 protein, partial [Planctomycetaceae bacterium]